MNTADQAALDDAAAAWQRILGDPAFIAAAEPFQLAVFNNAAVVFARRYSNVGQVSDLDRAVDLWQRAVACTPRDSREFPGYLNNLGNGLRERYARSGRLDDLEKAIQAHQQAVACTPQIAPEFPGCLTNLAADLSELYSHTGQLDRLEEAIRLYRQAVVSTPPHASELRMYLNNLGTGLSRHYAATGLLEELDESVQIYKHAVAITPLDAPELPTLLNNLGNGLRDRYARSGQPEDLEEAIRVYQHAVARTPPSALELPRNLSNLAGGLLDRYARTGQLTDMNQAIRAYYEAVAHTPPNAPDACGYLNNLGNGLRDRYRRTGRLEDIEEAIRVYQQAVASVPPSAPDLCGYLSNLGSAIRDRYFHTGRYEDIEEAIQILRQAAACAPSGGHQLTGCLSNLGNVLHDRYARAGRSEDLEEAIRVHRQSVAGTSRNSPDLPSRLNNLGGCLRSRYAWAGQLDDLAEAIQVFQDAVRCTPPDSPDLPRNLCNLGTGLSDRYACLGRQEDLDAGRRAYERALHSGLELAPEDALHGARNWGNWAFERTAWEEVSTAYQGVFAAIDRLLRDQILRAGKESWLREAQGLAGRMAYALAKVGRGEDAVVTLETGRARLLAEALEHSRRDLELLPQRGYGDLYQSYRQASETVQNLQHADRAAGSSAGSSLAVPAGADRHQAIQAAREAIDAAIAGIRQVAGFEDFLVAPTWDRIQRAVTPDTPLVYLVTTSAGSLALIVRNDTGRSDASPQRKQEGNSEDRTGRENLDGTPSNPSPRASIVWLDEFREADLNRLLVKRTDGDVAGGYLPGQFGRRDWLRASLDEALPLLGAKLLGRLAAALRSSLQMEPSGSGDPPHIVLIPTGRLSLLPLHAAQYAVDGRDGCLLDEFVVSYAISATALAKARQEAQLRSNAPLRLVGVGNPLPESADGHVDPPGSLPFARAELESIAEMLPDGAPRVFYEHNANRQALLDALPGANLVHLSCHGRFRPDDPLASGLLLADGELTLRDIIAAGFTALAKTRLAVLSACQTAIQDFRNLPDEAIGLPAGFTQAGVPSVLGTLWSVNDASTAFLMVRFYELLLQDRLPPPVALRHAQRWLRDATNAELDAYLSRHEAITLARQQQSERMPMMAVHALLGHVLKGDPKERPYSHPYYWAPFVFYGAEGPL